MILSCTCTCPKRIEYLRNSLKTFFTSFSECSPIPESEGIVRKGNLNTVGAQVVLGCQEGFINNYYVGQPLPVTVQCVANDTHAYWSIKPFECIPGMLLQKADTLFYLLF